jgi:hypothetical protein
MSTPKEAKTTVQRQRAIQKEVDAKETAQAKESGCGL